MAKGACKRLFLFLSHLLLNSNKRRKARNNERDLIRLYENSHTCSRYDKSIGGTNQ